VDVNGEGIGANLLYLAGAVNAVALLNALDVINVFLRSRFRGKAVSPHPIDTDPAASRAELLRHLIARFRVCCHSELQSELGGSRLKSIVSHRDSSVKRVQCDTLSSMTRTMITVRFPDDLLAKMKEEAIRRKRSRAFLVIEAVEEKYQTNGKKPITPSPKKKAGTR
jgi:hypothetical protein